MGITMSATLAKRCTRSTANAEVLHGREAAGDFVLLCTVVDPFRTWRVVIHHDVEYQRPSVEQRFLGIIHFVQTKLEIHHVTMQCDFFEAGSDYLHRVL